jgi:hypothetical protein
MYDPFLCLTCAVSSLQAGFRRCGGEKTQAVISTARYQNAKNKSAIIHRMARVSGARTLFKTVLNANLFPKRTDVCFAITKRLGRDRRSMSRKNRQRRKRRVMLMQHLLVTV